MKSVFLKDPLLHFLGLGFGLLILFQFTGNQESEERNVLVDRETLLTFLQYQSVAFDREQFELFLDDMSQREIEDLIQEAAREEILYREALALGLDSDDYIIRSRLVQKLRYLSEGFSNENLSISEEDILAYFESNRRNYDIDPFITFTHVFYNSQRRGEEAAHRLAEEKLVELNNEGVTFEEAANHGDRFPYFVNYVERPPQLIASHLGGDVAEDLFQITPNSSLWHGPFESSFGFHLVMITNQAPQREPAFQEVRDRVESDAQAAQARENTALAIQEIMDRYEIVIDPVLMLAN
ncbi:MAG: hypothetical protein CMD70_03785 [Gammaproteobacteria bacterium]|nr:hypothetical protein [Gammaproteobacteria bacterium]|tara:strand:- start:1130 stop:2017 length:888 start_codon:yes stop_codon:yes gene_type:complete